MSLNLGMDTQNWLSSFRTEDERLTSMQSSIMEKNARVVCLTGGKGGVGKTSVSLKMSLELAQQNFKVLLIDCDHNLSNTSIKLNLPLNDNFTNLLLGGKDLDECLYKRGNFHLLSGANGSLDLFEGEYNFSSLIIDIVNSKREEYDFIILDSPAGISEHTTALASYADDRVYVLNPDSSSITDAYSLMKVLKTKFDIKENHLIVNKVKTREQYTKVVKTISETAENFINVRTIVLGNISYVDTEKSFDQEFLGRQNSLSHKLVLKIIQKYVDRIGDKQSLGLTQMRPNKAEHEAQFLS